ncbi:MAG: fibronectin type III domain-containing protein [Patescibacteria group bacterium]|nr:fibronectin type III domain-containing protein [Patescibacteria group bacterium]
MLKRFVIPLSVVIFFVGGGFLLVNAAPPPQPTSFTAAAISSCGVELAWDQGEGADSFQFHVRVDGGTFTNWSPAPGSGSGMQSFNHTLLDPERDYEYEVRACYNVGGCSFPSVPDSDTTPALPSAASPPAVLEVENWVGGTQVALSWLYSNIDTATSGFRVFRSDDDGANFNPVGTFSLADFQGASPPDTWTDPVSTDDPHQYKIKTYQTDSYCNAVDNSTPEGSSWVNFSSGFSSDLIVPQRPATLTEIETRSGGTEARFGWTDVSDETDFRFQISQDPGFASLDVDTTYPANITETGWITFAPATTYFYRVRACNESSGNTGCSDYRTNTFTSSYPAPKNLKTSLIFASSTPLKGNVYLSWEDEATYERVIRIYRKIDSEATFPATPLVELFGYSCFGSPPTCTYDNFYTDRDIDLGEIYEYEVRFFIVVENEESGSSNKTSVNLKIAFVLKGVGWASAGDGSVGWVKFNSAAEGGQVSGALDDYSVQVDRDGLFSGVAWASVEGGHGYNWLSFNEADLVGCPSGSCEARLASSTGEVSGWARFLNPQLFSAGVSDWDGWVHLRGSSYGVSFDEVGKTFSGAAWGDDVVGWIGFNTDTCSNCTVRAEQVNRAPTISNVTIDNGPPGSAWCNANPYFSVGWEYTDPDGDPRTMAEIEFMGPTTHLETDTNIESAFNQNYLLFDPLASLQADSTYSARVRVFDGIDWSGWVSSGADVETTPTHYPPLVDFEWSPTPVTGAIINFNGEDGTIKTDDRSGGVWPPSGWTWTWDFFGNASPNQPGGPKASVIFSTLPSDVSLEVTDGSGAFCEATTNLTGGAGTSLKRRIFRER